MIHAGGIVLCGGHSARMGKPKAWLPIASELMLPRVVRLLRSVVQPVVVVAAAGQELPPLPAEIRIVRDNLSDRGPLQGLAAGLEALAGEVEVAFLSSCDVPFLQPAFVERLVKLLGNHLICVPHVGDRHHPLAAVYRLEVAQTVAKLLEADKLRASLLLEAVSTRVVEAWELADVDPDFKSLRNLNTPEEYHSAVQEAKQAETSQSDANARPPRLES